MKTHKLSYLLSLIILLFLCIGASVADNDTTHGLCSFKLSNIRSSQFKSVVQNAGLCAEGDKCAITWRYLYDIKNSKVSFSTNLSPDAKVKESKERSVIIFGNKNLEVLGEKRTFSIAENEVTKTVKGILSFDFDNSIIIDCIISNNIITPQLEDDCANFINNPHPKDNKKDSCIAM